MKITLELLTKLNACEDGIKFFYEQNLEGKEHTEIINFLLESKRFNYILWFLPQLLTKENYVKLAVFSAEFVLPVFENECPNDKRPRLAIKAAKNWLKNPTKENEQNANSAAYSALPAYSAISVYSVRLANSANSARSANSAACSAIYSAISAIYSAYAACSLKSDKRDDFIKQLINQFYELFEIQEQNK